MLKIHKISDIRSVEAYLLDNVKPYDVIITDDGVGVMLMISLFSFAGTSVSVQYVYAKSFRRVHCISFSISRGSIGYCRTLW